jgi:phosphoribosyl-ATP pyrophosphohydrolase/phosphoribosyl-AMP cyclohydrolase
MSEENIEEGSIFDPQFNMRSPKSPEAELMTVVVQDADTKEILMTAFATRQALEKTLQTGKATFFSRSRGLWTKGDTSGDVLRVKDIYTDCDQDTLVYSVVPEGAGACHTKNNEGKARGSCFYRKVVNTGQKPFLETAQLPRDRMAEVFRLVKERQIEMPKGSSTAQAFEKGIQWILLKMLEEAGEVSTAVVKEQGREQLALESSQLLYRLLLVLANEGVDLEEIMRKL